MANSQPGHHKRKVKRGGIAYLAKDREGKEVFKGCYSIAETKGKGWSERKKK